MPEGGPDAAVPQTADFRKAAGSGGTKAAPGIGGLKAAERWPEIFPPPAESRQGLLVEGAVESDILFGGTDDGISVSSLNDVGVTTAQNGRKRSRFQAITQEMAANRESGRHSGDLAAPGTGGDDSRARLEIPDPDG